MFLNSVDEHIIEMKKALELLSFSSYNSYRKDINNCVICHNDLAEHNFLISNQGMYLLDFDYRRLIDNASIRHSFYILCIGIIGSNLKCYANVCVEVYFSFVLIQKKRYQKKKSRLHFFSYSLPSFR